MDKHIDIHPISESDATDEDEAEELHPAVANPHSASAAREHDTASLGSAEDDDKLPAESEKPSVAVQAESVPLTSIVEGSDLDDSLRIKDLDTGREMMFQQVTLCRESACCSVLLDLGFAAKRACKHMLLALDVVALQVSDSTASCV